MSSPKFALIGNGYIAPRHVAAIEKVGGELVLICDNDYTKRIMGVPFCQSIGQLNAMPEWKSADYAVICLPNDLHVEVAKFCVAEGKQVLCEKPLGISVNQIRNIVGISAINTVLQLRYHPLMQELKAKDPKNIDLIVKVKREASYWKGWKGESSRSGGILFNLGVHYIDALMHLCGSEIYGLDVFERSDRKVIGQMQFKGKPPVKFHIEISDTDEGQTREIIADGTSYVFSNRDNLSMEDLHVKVYEDLIKGVGVKPRDVFDLTKLLYDIRRKPITR